MALVEKVCKAIPTGKTIILYSNGHFLTFERANMLFSWGVKYINIGLHNPADFKRLIEQCTRETGYCLAGKLQVRFHAQDIYKEQLEKDFPNVNFRFWKMNDCDRGNEDRIVLI